MLAIISAVALILMFIVLAISFDPDRRAAFFVSPFFWESLIFVLVVFTFLLVVTFEGARTNAETIHFL